MAERDLVFDALARAGLGLSETTRRAPEWAGTLALHPHQVEAVERLRPILRTHHGALLADAVGLGKTYVALAIAADYHSADVLAPAGLLPMWRGAIARAQMTQPPDVRSLHAFSTPRVHTRGSVRAHPHLVIIDEAHHLRNPTTRRYRAVAEWCRRAHVLLLSATPIHNMERDLEHLLALFLGSRAGALDSAQRSAIIVRRNVRDLDDTPGALRQLPTVVSHAPLPIGDSVAVTRGLSSLPPPLPTRDGTAAGALVTMGLIRAWCSSGAACLSMVARRRARALALAEILAQGRWPSRHELRAWTVTEDTVQLGFTELLVEACEQHDAESAIQRAREQLALHTEALSALTHIVRAAAPQLDRTRVEAIRRVRSRHRGVAVIAFSQFADTVRGLGRLLQWDSGVAMLTSQGGRVAGGAMRREELLRRIAPRAHGVARPVAHERIYLVLTTDLLAEGVNLQDAGVVVHLDLPWTPAAIAQREGRIARLGSGHEQVHVYSLASPGGGEELMRLAARLRRKARAVSVALALEGERPGERRSERRSDRAGTGQQGPHTPHAMVSLPTASSPMHRTLRRWRASPAIEQHSESPARAPDGTGAHSTARSNRTRGLPASTAIHVVQHIREGWLATVGTTGTHTRALCGGWFTAGGRQTHATNDVRTLSRLIQAAHSAPDYLNAPQPAVARYRELALRACGRRARAGQAHAAVEAVVTPQHRAQRHVRRLLASLSLSERIRVAPKAALAVRTISALRGAGDELALDQLLGETGRSLNADTWLDAVIALTDATEPLLARHAPADIASAADVFTLLLLLR